MCILNIKGLRFYGRLNDDHLKALFKVANVLNKQDIKGIKGVYCIDGKKTIKDKYYSGGHYIQFTRINNNSCVSLEMKYANGDKETIKVYNSPIIVINGDLCHTEYDFVFCLLHEIGHHIYNGFYTTDKQKEITAHLYAIEKIKKIYNIERIPVKPYLYLKEALELTI